MASWFVPAMSFFEAVRFSRRQVGNKFSTPLLLVTIYKYTKLWHWACNFDLATVCFQVEGLPWPCRSFQFDPVDPQIAGGVPVPFSIFCAGRRIVEHFFPLVGRRFLDLRTRVG